ncbi:hypothetical protein CW712_01770 [Candidatus Bathyarchaeota archaeon]|nr:MAG: hypothetical protein CW712_01770 [Candidatus Bathyarchaeota archaeon]
MSPREFRESLEQSKNYADLFVLVKKAVKKVLGLNRAGLMLYLGDLPLRVAAFHQVGSNGIVLNRRILEIMSRSTSTLTELNSFIFTLLLHEYLHSLGYLDESVVRNLVHHISLETFGADHPTVEMALNPPLPRILPPDIHDENVPSSLVLVKDFERSDHPYIV